MSLETFFDNLTLLAEAPNGIAKLRELILRLAMKGRLVPQDSQDEPAKELLKAIADQRRQEAQKEGGRRIQALPPLSLGEVPYKLPEGWEWERLGNIGDTNIGLTYSPKDIDLIGVPVLRSGNIQSGKIDLSNLVRVALRPKENLLVQLGDLVICARNGSRALVGKAALIEDLREETSFGAFMAIFRSRINNWIHLFICSPLFRQMIDDVNTTTINQITQANLRSTIAPIPPPCEQERIVAKVDQLMRLCDEVEARQQAKGESRFRVNKVTLAPLNNVASLATEKFEQASARLSDNFAVLYDSAETVGKLRSTILQLAVQGKLVSQDPRDESASLLLKEINKEKARLLNEKKLRRIDTYPPISGNTAPFPLPKGWTWSRGGEVSTFVTSGSRGWAAYYSVEGAIFIRIGNLDYDSISLDLRSIKYVSPPVGAEGTRTQVQDKDILISITGDTGMIGLVPNNFPEAYINQHIALFRPSESVCAEYLARVFTSPLAFDQLKGAQRGIKNSLGLDDIKCVMLPLPPLAEQRRIVAKVNQLMTLCDDLEAKLRQAEADSEKLMNAAVQHVISLINHQSSRMEPHHEALPDMSNALH